MRRTTALLMIAAAAASFGLAACGGGSIDRDALKNDLVEELRSLDQLTDEQITCITDGLDSFTDEELSALDSDSTPEDLNARASDMVSACLAG